MKYVKIPKPSSVDTVCDEQGVPLRYTFNAFLNELVWTSKEWRNPNDPEMQATMVRLYELFSAAGEGEVVPLQDKDHERLARVSSMKDKDLAPGIVVLVTKHLYAITSASDKEPKQEETEEAQA